jgi:hypothetical protein
VLEILYGHISDGYNSFIQHVLNLTLCQPLCRLDFFFLFFLVVLGLLTSVLIYVRQAFYH